MLFARFFAIVTPVICTTFTGAALARKTTISFPAQRVVFTTASNVTTLISILEAEIRPDLYGKYASVISGPISSRNVTAFEAAVELLLGPTGFMFFGVRKFDDFMKLYEPVPPVMRAYTIGNPIIAKNMALLDPTAPLHVPLTLVVGGDGEITRIEYDLPSSLIGHKGKKASQLLNAAKVLDAKVDIMVRKVTGN